MRQGKNFLRTVTDTVGLETESLPGVPLVEIYNNQRVLIENHHGILSYECHEIHIRMCYGKICVCGENLELRRISKEQLVITGNICALTLRG